MNESNSLVGAQLQHLLQVVEQHRDERCQTLLDEANAQARQLLKAAWHEGRTRLHQAVLDNREQVRRQMASAQARQQTQLRIQQQREDQALLARAWQPLQDKLLQRWRRADSRRQWIDGLLVQATANLIDPHWHIEHPPDWPEAECADMATRLHTELGHTPIFSPQTEISAGLRIRAGDARIDGTSQGLLRARERIEAMILAALNDCRGAAVVTAQPQTREPSPGS